jgi:hypothetical protein
MICYDGWMNVWMDGFLKNFFFFLLGIHDFVMMDGTGSQQCSWNLDFIIIFLS